MKTDFQIQQDVIEHLRWEPALNSTEIGVTVKNGVVTLFGVVDTFFKKAKAEEAAKNVVGVKAIAEEIMVRVSPQFKRSDAEIAEAVLHTLRWHTSIPDETIKVRVEDGIVRLEGTVDWNYQRKVAVEAISGLPGIRLIQNNIVIRPVLTPDDVIKRISAAFHRSATVDSARIKVTLDGSKVRLTGKVKSIAEREEAITAALSAPGIVEVEHMLEVEVPEYSYED